MVKIDSLEELFALQKRGEVLNQDLQDSTARLMDENEGMQNAFKIFALRKKRLATQLKELRRMIGNQMKEASVMLEAVLRINEDLYRRANFDHLTGLQNRAGFQELIQAYHDNGVRHGVFFSLDIDKFKSINDSYSHATGDEVLKKAAGKFSEVFRASDPISRISRSRPKASSDAETTTAGRRGGEEIIVFLPTANINNAIERMRANGFAVEIQQDSNGDYISIELPFQFPNQDIETARVENNNIPKERMNKITFSGSIREVSIPDELQNPGEFVDHLVNLGEADLYSAKEHGRSKVYLRKQT
jgi:GGDEF domain-containing protein